MLLNPNVAVLFSRVDSESFHYFGGALDLEPQIPGLSGLVQDVLYPHYLRLFHKG